VLPYPELKKEIILAHVHLFCDESGKVHNSPAISFCGYLGNGDQWSKFRDDWSALRRSLQVPPIHMKAIMRPELDEEWTKVKQRWGSDWESKRDSMLADLAEIICGHKLVSVGATVDCDAFKTLNIPKARAGVYNDPHYLAFQWVVLRSLEKVEWGTSDALLGLLLDDDEEKAMSCYALLRSLKKQHPESKKRISSICFVNDEVYPGVQAADVLAFESRRLLIERQSKPSKLFERLTSELQHSPHLFDERALLELEKQFP